MIWQQKGNRFVSPPYQIIRCTRGFELWYRSAERYHLVAREVMTLAEAKALAARHGDTGDSMNQVPT